VPWCAWYNVYMMRYRLLRALQIAVCLIAFAMTIKLGSLPSLATVIASILVGGLIVTPIGDER
jgi:hypothetical protein